MADICNFGKYMNPRAMWCYPFEDIIGHSKKGAAACVDGTAMHMVPGKLVDRYIRALSLVLADWE